MRDGSPVEFVKDLVSIVIPNYNLGALVGDAVASALAQTYRNVEVIVVDDGSTDDSLARIRELPAFRGGALRLVEQANTGVSSARNAGARVARGTHIAFLDADDLLSPAYVERCLDALRSASPSVAYAYTQMQLFGAESTIFASRSFSRWVLLRGNFVNASALLRREAFDRVGGWDSSFSMGYEDHELWIRMLAHGYSGVFVPEPLLRYRRHPGGSRNDLSAAMLKRLHFDIAVRHPGLYWPELLTHPSATAAALRRKRAGG
jgi:glycosyltransferase involved in cell wall biosynthesis